MIKQIKTAFQIAIKSLLGLVSLIGLSNCIFLHRPVSESEAVGTYQAVPAELYGTKTGLPDGGVEILELKPDGTCEQDITLKDGRKFSAKGTWKYYPPPHAHIIMKGTYVVVEGEKIAPNIEATIDTVRDFSIGRDFYDRIILGTREYTHYEKK